MDKQEKVIDLVASMLKRRRELKALYGDEAYKDTVSSAIDIVKEHMLTKKETNPMSAALYLAKAIKGNSMLKSFIMCAGLEISEGNDK